MLSNSERQKKLPDWLELDGHRRGRGLKRWRRRLTWYTFGLCTVLAVVAVFLPRTSKLAQAGPVSPAHTQINDCAACHTEPLTTATRFLPWKNHVKAVPNSACAECHKDIGDHHPQAVQSVQACAGCHREHQGQRLAQVANAYCLECHNNLKSHHTKPDLCQFQDVTGYPSGHPDMALWRGSDPLFPNSQDQRSHLKFNHKIHVAEHGLPTRGESKEALEARQRLRDKGAVLFDNDRFVRLDCTFCHAPDSAGRYMQPVTYQRHCADCHPLWVRLEEKQFPQEEPDVPEGQRLIDLVRQFNRVPAPHVRSSEVRNALAGRLIDLVRLKPLQPAPPPEARRGPLPFFDDPRAQQRWELLRPDLKRAENVLFVLAEQRNLERGAFGDLGPEGRRGECVHCHVETAESSQKRQRGEDVPPEYGLSSWRVRPDGSRSAEHWFSDARFDHRSHATVGCGRCHAAATSEKSSDVLLPKMETCAQCHNTQVGVRNDCVGCHQYHPRGGTASHSRRCIEEHLKK
jgi:hypothetical protein